MTNREYPSEWIEALAQAGFHGEQELIFDTLDAAGALRDVSHDTIRREHAELAAKVEELEGIRDRYNRAVDAAAEVWQPGGALSGLLLGGDSITEKGPARAAEEITALREQVDALEHALALARAQRDELRQVVRAMTDSPDPRRKELVTLAAGCAQPASDPVRLAQDILRQIDAELAKEAP